MEINLEQQKNGEDSNQASNLNLQSPLQHYQELLKSPMFKITSRETEYKNHPLGDHEIEEPQSALHSGDFTEGARQNKTSHEDITSVTGQYSECNSIWPASEEIIWQKEPPNKNALSSPELKSETSTIWPTFSSTLPAPSSRDLQNSNAAQLSRSRFRTTSLSSPYSPSFILKAPTSPLARSHINEDLEPLPTVNPLEISSKLQIYQRRHTLQSPQTVNPTLNSYETSTPLSYDCEKTPITISCSPFYKMSTSTPQIPLSLSRHRSECTSDLPQIYHASMVGSYEESILHGRMSTTPSKPLDFLAEIGVLGTGECKPSLRCPAHLTIPFHAVFFSYETTSNGQISESEHGPSPYVGLIDIENNPRHEVSVRVTKRKKPSHQSRSNNEKYSTIDALKICHPGDLMTRTIEKNSRRFLSMPAPPRGSYRIPKTGQIQIIIKNPNKTAVKLFLVPYNLSGMEPGTKTFIRQRSYSTGPVINVSSPQSVMSKLSDKKILRYLVHLQICSPSSNRFYLYKSIRVVFANRVPDCEEKLWNEISLPEPRFNKYKPSQESRLSSDANKDIKGEEITFSRRSLGFVPGYTKG